MSSGASSQPQSGLQQITFDSGMFLCQKLFHIPIDTDISIREPVDQNCKLLPRAMMECLRMESLPGSSLLCQPNEGIARQFWRVVQSIVKPLGHAQCQFSLDTLYRWVSSHNL